jgi:hypothetical protein
MDGKPSSQTKARWIVLAVFAIGFTAGALSMNLYERLNPGSPEQPKQKPQEIIVKKMDQKLNLSRQQSERIRAILDETFNQYAEVRKELEPVFKGVEPKFNDIRQKSRDRMRAELNENQLPKFEEMLKEEDKRREEFRHGQNK